MIPVGKATKLRDNIIFNLKLVDNAELIHKVG